MQINTVQNIIPNRVNKLPVPIKEIIKDIQTKAENTPLNLKIEPLAKKNSPVGSNINLKI